MTAAIDLSAGDLSGKVAVVSGAAGAIGTAIVEGLAARGATVVGTDREAAGRGAPQGTELRRLDVTDVAAVRSLADAIVEQHGSIDIWVNNAGYLQRTPALEVEPEAWQRTIDVNLTATFFGAQAAARHMVRQGAGAIVNLSSYAGFTARPQCPDYAAAKAGVAHLTACLATEWGSAGVRVNAVAPGYILTPMSAWMHDDPDERDALLSGTPLPRLGTTSEVADAVAYLVSDQSSYVTGHTLFVDGGKARA
ncbi:SDR family NAD(P)-dependent oxidoreductase [Agrococcus sp. Marseille-P2731]|uniref:SDR family NAD(P)-dependent oxidoreductase n=1 Tax=Agrococcus sp. Marseille-P2731 TaxID=1841862 RepID=UPI00190EC805|nr:glucose 1-dehydrogenase [Agrococcus sp. Marseille-P2731]